jgi:hypothetical protein
MTHYEDSMPGAWSWDMGVRRFALGVGPVACEVGGK